MRPTRSQELPLGGQAATLRWLYDSYCDSSNQLLTDEGLRRMAFGCGLLDGPLAVTAAEVDATSRALCPMDMGMSLSDFEELVVILASRALSVPPCEHRCGNHATSHSIRMRD